MASTTIQSTRRLASVDVFRGIVMARMMIGVPLIPAVATLPPGRVRDAIDAQLHHAVWHGMTWVDFSFAAYVMLMGLAVRLSLKRFGDNTADRSDFYRKVLRRTLILFLLGFLYNGGFSEHWPDIRIFGVLQRMAVCYLAAALIYTYTSVLHRTIVLLAILLVYWAMMALIPVPGGSPGDFTFNGNLAAWIDSQSLPGRLYYGSWDPEGLLTTLPAIGSAVIGLLWGDLLLSNKQPMQKVIWLCTAGLLAINVGIVWDIVFPINKPLWTSSFVMVNAGIGSIVLGICYLFVEVFEWRRLLLPFEVIGRNLLTAFMIMGLIPLSGIALRICGGDVTWLLGPTAPFVTALTETMLVWLLLLFLYRHNIAIRL